MFFINQTNDTPLLQELIREAVFNSAFWEALPLPAEGHLMDILVGSRAKIVEKSWLDWLIRKHECTRIPALEPTPVFIKALSRPLLTESLHTDCYPLSTGDNHLIVGIGRPDYPEHLSHLLKFYKKTVVYRNALSLNEIASLRTLCHQALQTL